MQKCCLTGEACCDAVKACCAPKPSKDTGSKPK
jgi:hypothetical protein